MKIIQSDEMLNYKNRYFKEQIYQIIYHSTEICQRNVTHLKGCLPRCLVILSKRVFKKFAQSMAGSLCRDVTTNISSIPYASPINRKVICL